MVVDDATACYAKYLERKALYKNTGYDVDTERAFILEKALPVSGEILEIGTGKGHFSIALAQAGYRFTTFDVSPVEQAFAKLNLEYLGLEGQVRFCIGDGEHFDFPDQSFDVIFSINTLHHLENAARVTDELNRILRPEGRLVVSDFTREGFKVVDRIHKMEGKSHARGKTSVSDLKLDLMRRGFVVYRYASRFQDVLIAQRRSE